MLSIKLLQKSLIPTPFKHYLPILHLKHANLLLFFEVNVTK